MTADIRTAAEAETEATAHFGPPDFSAPNDRTIKWATYVQGFTEGAVWAHARVTPTREQIERALIGRNFIAGTDAILALLAGLGERENNE